MVLNRWALATVRKLRNQRAAAVARAAGISPGYLHDLESGRRKGAVAAKIAEDLAAALDVDVEAITYPETAS